MRLRKKLAATYSRGSYTTTTIGKAVFDGRVRDGIGSDHSFMATKNFKELCSLKTTHRFRANRIREFKSHSLQRKSDQAARPISISPLSVLRRVHA